jgi:hypothetical protein
MMVAQMAVSDEGSAALTCSKCGKPITRVTWSMYKKRCRTCHEKNVALNKVDTRVSFPAMLYVLCIMYGHVFLSSWLDGLAHPENYYSSTTITNGICTIGCYVVGATACMFFVRAIARQKREKPEVYAAQRWFPIIFHAAILIVTAIIIPIEIMKWL